MKKLKIATLGILALLLILPASLKAELLFSTSQNTITITGSNPKASGNLVIPSTINNLPVTSIGRYAFQYCSGLTSVTLPSSITSIGERAFWACTGLTSVTLPSSITEIGERAFWGCSGLKGITVDIANSTYSSNDGILFNKAQTSLIAFPGGKTGAYTIPNSVTSIGNGAFNGSTGLTSVTLPSSITSIGQETFSRCSGLTSVYFMGNAPDTDSYIFENSFNLTVYHSPDSAGWGATFANRPTALWFADGLLGSINGNAITITGRNPKPTGDLIIPSTINGLPVTSIGDSAFYGSYELTSITIPNSITSIGEAAFYGCSGLTSITIPSGVTFIGSEAFMWCDGLTGVYFLGNAPAKGYGVFGGVLGA
ncbi:MAG: leucine-rich repeat domain-containing protein, partial [Verrucomicrobia bacterium]